MTTHELARYLLEHTPNLPVFINGWGSDEGADYQVECANVSRNGESVYLDYEIIG